MKRYSLKDRLKESFSLVVSLTENDPTLAQALESAGAHAIKVHLNVVHRASKTHFLSWDEEKQRISGIPAALSIPVGIVPGAEQTASEQEMEAVASCGFDFLDIFAHHCPSFYLKPSPLSRSLALDWRFDLRLLDELGQIGADMFELSVIAPEEYGLPLCASDLALYRHIASRSSVPVFIPTQRRIRPEETGYLRDCGAGGIAIGAVVTTGNYDEILRTTEAFRRAIDAL